MSAEYSRVKVSEAKRLKALENENTKLKSMLVRRCSSMSPEGSLGKW